MPEYSGCYNGQYRRHCREVAIAQVRAKFPDMPVGSSGWHRAVENRYKRLLRTH